MRGHVLQDYIGVDSGEKDIGVIVNSIETGKGITVSYDVAAVISEYGELLLSIDIEKCAVCPYLQKYKRDKNDAAGCVSGFGA